MQQLIFKQNNNPSVSISFHPSLAGEHVGLEDAVLVVAPLLEPDVLVLQHLRDDRLVGTLEPDLAEGPHAGLQPVYHPQDADRGTQSEGRVTFSITFCPKKE